MAAPLPEKRPTLADVACVAGVSGMTVSRVVRGTKVVKAKTVARVRQAIAELGYQPDPALSALAAYRTNRAGSGQGNGLAFIDCDGTPYSANVLAGVKQEAAWLGYGVESFRLPTETAARRRLGRLLFHRGFHGVLIGPSDVSWKFDGWDWSQFAAVSIGALVHEPALHAVAMDYFQGAMDGAQTLRGQGCRRIALAVEGALETRTNHRWIGGYSAWCGGVGQSALYLEPLLGATALGKSVRRQRIDGVLTIHRAVWEALRGLGVKVFFLNEVESPAMASHLALEPGKIGAEGVRVLHPMLLRREFGLPDHPKMVGLRGALVVEAD